MTRLYIPRCYHCSAPLPPRPPGAPGRPRRWCSDRCRKAFTRAHRWHELEPALIAAVELPELPPRSSPDDLVVQAIIEARVAAATFARVAPVARRDFGWRCEFAAKRIARCIDDLFPGV